MANKAISRALALAFKNPAIKSMDDFWPKFGRPDLVGVSDLVGCPVLQSIAYEVGKVFADPKEKTKPKPVTTFVLEPLVEVRVNGKLKRLPSKEFTLYSLHPTKGWRGSKIDASEKDDAVNVKNYTLLREWPKGRVRSAA